MIRLYLFAMLSLAGLITCAQAANVHVRVTKGGSSNEEFVGPFASWQSVKAAPCNAVGNGTADDTVAIQTCIDLLPTVPAIWFPAGTYKITACLHMGASSCTSGQTGLLYVGFIGADPATTKIIWAGSAGGTMLAVRGVAYSRIARLTFDGQGSAATLIDQDWDAVHANFDSGNLYTDVALKGATDIAFRCGNTGGCAETSMLRDQFINNTNGGILIKNFNALNMWVWYGIFQNNGVGIGNDIPGGENGAGAFHVYNSVFQSQTIADIAYGNTKGFNIVGNYSIGSKAFVLSGGTGGSDFALFQRNTILDTTQTQAIGQNDRGPVILLDNIIRSAAGSTYSPSPCDELGRRAGTCPVVMVGDFNVPYPTEGYDLFSMGNTFTLGSGICSTGSPAVVNGRCHSVSDQIVTRGSVNPVQPTLPSTPQNLGRAIYEAAPSGSGTACSVASPCSVQQAVTSAAAGCGNDVAHIRFGNYSIGSTITVPANCRVQIIGDGYSSLLISSGADPVMRLSGPSLATLGYFAVNGIAQGQDGIEIDNVDAAGKGGRVFIEGGLLSASTINLFADSIDYANVEAHDLQNLNISSSGGVTVTGGAHGGQFSQYLGLTVPLSGGTGFSFSGTANANVNGAWNETGAGATNLLHAAGSGTVTYSGSFFETTSSTLNAAGIVNFTGKAALVGLFQERLCPGDGPCGTWGNMSITGSGIGGQVLGLGLVGPSTVYWNDTSGDTNKFLSSQQYNTGEVTEIGTADPTFLTATLRQMRTSLPGMPSLLFSGQTNVTMYRVSVNNARYGIHLVKN